MANETPIPIPLGIGVVTAVPYGHSVVHRFAARSLAHMAYPIGTTRASLYVDDMPLDVAREALAEKALASGAKYLLFVDDDIAMPSFGLRYLMATAEQYDDVGAVAGIYPSRSEPCEPCIFVGRGQGPYWRWKCGTVFEVDAAGPGFMLIRLSALAAMPHPWFAFRDDINPDPNAEVQQVGQSEDFFFAGRLKAAGYRMLAHGAVLCSHCDRKSGRVYEIPKDSYPFQ
jgi:hypothetical protein